MNHFSHSAWHAIPLDLNDYFSPELLPYLKQLEFSPNEIIFHINEKPASLLLLCKGTAKKYISQANAKMPLVQLLQAPDYIGALEFVGAQQTSEEIRAVTTCHCLEIPLEKCRRQLLADTAFLRQLCCMLGKRNAETTETYAYNQTYPLENRLARFILHHLHGDLYTARQMDAAEYLGTSYRHLLHVMAHFIEQGILKKTPYGYAVTNSALLQELAERT